MWESSQKFVEVYFWAAISYHQAYTAIRKYVPKM
jgi:hypothetical protein